MQKYVSLEIAKRLKELGIEINSEKCWTEDSGGSCIQYTINMTGEVGYKIIPALDIAELLEWFKEKQISLDMISCLSETWKIGYRRLDDVVTIYPFADTEWANLIEALAEMLIYLNEKGD